MNSLRPDCRNIESYLEKIAENMMISNDISVRVLHMHETQVRQDMRLLSLEENQREAKEFRVFVRDKLEEMTALGVKVAVIMGAASLGASALVALILKKI